MEGEKPTTHFYMLREWKHESGSPIGNADLTHTIQKMVIMPSSKYGMKTGQVARTSQVTLADASWLLGVITERII